MHAIQNQTIRQSKFDLISIQNRIRKEKYFQRVSSELKMFNFKLKQIDDREAYIDNLSDDQIATLKTKQLFLKAEEELPIFNICPSEPNFSKNSFETVNTADPGSTLLKHILETPQNSYQQIELIENSMQHFDDPDFNQILQIKKLYDDQKEQIRNSGLKVRDFLEIYESEELADKDMNDPLVKKIMAFFETNIKEHDFFDLISCIIGNLQTESEKYYAEESKEANPKKNMKRIRQSICSFQGLKIEKEEQGNEFNEEVKKQMDKILSYYSGVLNLFKVDDDQ